jgi:hypothetical protein
VKVLASLCKSHIRFVADRVCQNIAQNVRQLVQISSFPRRPKGACGCPENLLTTYFFAYLLYDKNRAVKCTKNFTIFMHVLCSFLYTNEAGLAV